MATDDEETMQLIFQQFYEDNPGLYAIQWADASGINRFGYPEANSLIDYDYRSNRTFGDEKFLTAIEAKEEVSFDLTLIEGNTGRFFLCPIYLKEQYLGLVYTIRMIH